MNYLDVIIQGYCHDNNRKHLADYFYRQIETAVKGEYSAKEFYDGCLLVLNEWEAPMYKSLIERQNMLSLMIDRANNGEADLSVLDKKPISKKGYIKQLETELNTITVQNYPAQLSTLTKHKATGVIYYDGIQYIKDALKKAYKRTLFIYDDFGELFRYAVRYELISGIEVTQVGTESYLLKLNTYNFEFNSWLQEIKGWDYGNEKQYNEYLNKETFKEFLKYRQKQEQQRQNEIEAEKQSWAIELPQPIVKQKPELKIDQIALKYAYEGLQITRENGNEIAKEYGHNSGEKLFQRFTYFSSSANRKGKPNLCTPKKLDNKIKLIESIIELLPTDKQQRAKDEVSILKKIYEAEYQ